MIWNKNYTYIIQIASFNVGHNGLKLIFAVDNSSFKKLQSFGNKFELINNFFESFLHLWLKFSISDSIDCLECWILSLSGFLGGHANRIIWNNISWRTFSCVLFLGFGFFGGSSFGTSLRWKLVDSFLDSLENFCVYFGLNFFNVFISNSIHVWFPC